MKQIPLLQGKALLIELPEGAKDLDIFKAHYGQQLMYTDKFDYGATFDLPEGNWRIIGMLSEVREEQTANLVETIGYIGHDTDTWPVFKDYNDNQDGFLYALESLESAIEAAGYTFENKERCPQLSDYDDNCFGVTSWDDMPLEDQFQREKWEAAQSRVLDRSRCLLLGREI